MIKYGVESFQLEELCCSKDREYALKTIEPLLIAQYQATDDRYGYNMTYGGEGNPGTPEVRDKISKALTGKRASVETCKRISDSHKGQIAWNKGKLASSETKQKQSKKKQRSYQITFDNGNTITIIGLKMFCMDHGYDRGSLFRLRQGKQKSHKGIIKIESL